MKPLNILITFGVCLFLSNISLSCTNNSNHASPQPKPKQQSNASRTTDNSNRNHLQFRDSVQSVEDSIRELNSIMDGLKTNKVVNYFFDRENYLYVNNQKLLVIKKGVNLNSLDTFKVFKKLGHLKTQRLISIILFLKNNYISSVYKDLYHGLYMYEYQDFAKARYEDFRRIILLDKGTPKPPISNVETVNLLDKKGNLYLVSFTDIRGII